MTLVLDGSLGQSEQVWRKQVLKKGQFDIAVDVNKFLKQVKLPTSLHTCALYSEPPSHILGVSEVTANLYCNCVHLYWEGCVIFSIFLR